MKKLDPASLLSMIDELIALRRRSMIQEWEIQAVLEQQLGAGTHRIGPHVITILADGAVLTTPLQ